MLTNIIIVLLLTASFQISGAFLSWLAIKNANKHHNTLLLIEIVIMIIIAGEIIVFSSLKSPAAWYGFAGGIAAVFILNRFIPHKHADESQRLGLLVFIAMCIHELPEGAAFGSAYLMNMNVGILTAALIALHNIPEGSIVVMPFLLKNKAKHAFILTAATQALYILGGIGAYLFLVPVSPAAQAISASIAAGAMIYIAFEELKFLR
jgi:ZIP family zinc transporter